MINSLPMGRVFGVCTAGFVFVVATCGGVAVLDGSGDERGSGGNSASSSSRASSTTQGPASVVSSSSTGGVTTCDQACGALYDCGLQGDANGMQLCPGFSGALREKNQFVMDCVDTCRTNPALLGLIDPSDCPGTISTLQMLSPDFNDACQFGL